jgi:hypothetical protein
LSRGRRRVRGKGQVQPSCQVAVRHGVSRLTRSLTVPTVASLTWIMGWIYYSVIGRCLTRT